MIRREAGNDWLLISQVEHARLAGELAAVWGNRNVPALPVPELLVPAIRHHDEGWLAWERQPEVDPEAARPRNFTEMPMADSTGIWSESIEFCGQGGWSRATALKRLQQFLDSRSAPLTPPTATLLEAVLQMRADFTFDELHRLITLQTDELLDRPTLEAGLADLEAAGIVRQRSLAETDAPLMPGDRYEIRLPRTGSSPLGRIWVGRHFRWLAEKAHENRQDQPDDLAAIEAFLEKYPHEPLSTLPPDAMPNGTGGPDELNRLIETGFRYVQFFDHASLWLCCAVRTEPLDLELPHGQPIRLIPRSAQEITIEPGPLAVTPLTLSIPARRIPQRVYADNTDLQTELLDSPLEELTWTIR